MFFRRVDVISTGDIFTTTNYPIIDLAAGGSIQGTIDALQKIVDMIIPVYGQEGGTMVIPGHGRLCDFGDVLNFREMTIIIRDRDSGHDQKGHDAGTGEGGPSDAGLRSSLWFHHRLLDDGQICGSRLQEPKKARNEKSKF